MIDRVLILGATGAFGTRLARRLAPVEGITLYLSSRHEARAMAAAADLTAEFPRASIEPIALDTANAFASTLAKLQPHVTIHTAGPFQGQNYETARAIVAAGSHYIDLADARAYVRDIRILNDDAVTRGVVAISGASSVPGLSSAVVKALAAGFKSVHSVDMAISPGNRAPRGAAVIRAVTSYCGEPFARLDGGRMRVVYGWTRSTRETIDGLGRRWLSECEVPDLDLLPAAYPELTSVRFRAGLELSALHFGLALIANLRRARLLPPLSTLAPVLQRAAGLTTPFGSNDGGMFVKLSGIDGNGRRRRREWHLVARDGDGPFIPVIPAIILLKRLVARQFDRPGAQSCFQLFDLDDFVAEVADLKISTKIIDHEPD